MTTDNDDDDDDDDDDDNIVLHAWNSLPNCVVTVTILACSKPD